MSYNLNSDYDLRLNSRSPKHSRIKDQTTKKWELYRDSRLNNNQNESNSSRNKEKYPWHYIVAIIGLVVLLAYYAFYGHASPLDGVKSKELDDLIQRHVDNYFEKEVSVKHHFTEKLKEIDKELSSEKNKLNDLIESK